MKIADFNLLKKMMQLTTSDNDAESLAAIRAANKILAKEPTTWDNVLMRMVKVMDPVESADAQGPDDPEMSEAFNILQDTRGNFGDLIRSIRTQWESGRKLSDRQREVVLDAARDRR